VVLNATHGTMRNGVAHVSFRGGSMFLPARTPYDRQVLVEHVAAHVRAKGQVQVLVDAQRWMVQFLCNPLPVSCSHCAASLDSAWLSPAGGGREYCAKCALGGSTLAVAAFHEPQRLVG